MKLVPVTLILCFSISGCYTIIYPPPEVLVDEFDTDSTVIVIPDSLRDMNITIINENQLIFDRYYHDLIYYRYGWFGRYGYWDPYYYNPRYCYRDHRWRHGRYYPHDSSGRAAPKPKKPRREKDYRRKPPASSENDDNSDSFDGQIKPNNQSSTVKTDNAISVESKSEPKIKESQPVKHEERRDIEKQTMPTTSEPVVETDRKPEIQHRENSSPSTEKDDQEKPNKDQKEKSEVKKSRRSKARKR